MFRQVIQAALEGYINNLLESVTNVKLALDLLSKEVDSSTQHATVLPSKKQKVKELLLGGISLHEPFIQHILHKEIMARLYDIIRGYRYFIPLAVSKHQCSITH